MEIRLARLEDTHTIGQLFRHNIERWQRINSAGQVEDLAYEHLTIYERWGHGGAWMSDETAVLWLSHLLRGGNLPYVLEDNGQVIGYLEAFSGDETVPLGKHLHIESLMTSQEAHADLLVQHAIQLAGKLGRIAVNLSIYDDVTVQFYQRHGFLPIGQIRRMLFPTQTGQGFYKTTDHPNADPSQIRGWGMILGRLSSARQHWETQWTALWDAVPEIAQERIHRLKCSASGHEAFLCFKQHFYDPRTVDVLCWSPKPLSSQLLIAIRDWAHRNQYRTLVMWGDASVEKLLGSEAELTTQIHQFLALEV
jgi:hypothetical protein